MNILFHVNVDYTSSYYYLVDLDKITNSVVKDFFTSLVNTSKEEDKKNFTSEDFEKYYESVKGHPLWEDVGTDQIYAEDYIIEAIKFATLDLPQEIHDILIFWPEQD